ncbi:MAG TPA: hypothetical protein ENJ53_00795, partial [Phaeodactylibacter sp.]|nr:hypothetical protein [Phaeodactylibacter sp.]
KKGFVIAGNIPLKFKDIPLPLGVKATTSLNYVEVPVLAKYNFGNGKVGGYIAAGSTLGYASSARFKTTTNFIIDINVIDKKLNLDALKISRLDIGGTVGVGGTVNFSGVQLFVDARYTHGFKKLDNVPVIDLDFNNRNFALTTGLMIPLTKKYKRPRA